MAGMKIVALIDAREKAVRDQALGAVEALARQVRTTDAIVAQEIARLSARVAALENHP